MYRTRYLHGSRSRGSAKSAIYTAAGWESKYRNRNCHDSPSRSSAKLAIYTAAGCQHKIATDSDINTTVVYPHKIVNYTATIKNAKSAIYSYIAAGCIQNRHLDGSRSRAKSAIYVAAGCIRKNVIYTAAVQEPNRLYTLLPGVFIKMLFKGQPFKAKSAIYTAAGCIHKCYTKSAIYIAAGCIHKSVIYTAAVKEPNRLYTLLPGVFINVLFIRQPFKSQIGYIHSCRVYS